jgi:hypothetical protein
MADASALLWRLELQGVDVGDRWDQLIKFWQPYRHLHTTSFNDIHLIMCLARANGTQAREAVESMRALAVEQCTDPETDTLATHRATNREVLREVGLSACEALLAYAEGDWRRVVDLLLPLRGPSMDRIGGSRAQRDVLDLTLLQAALRDQELWPIARDLLAERVLMKNAVGRGPLWDQLQHITQQLRHTREIGG